MVVTGTLFKVSTTVIEKSYSFAMYARVLEVATHVGIIPTGICFKSAPVPVLSTDTYCPAVFDTNIRSPAGATAMDAGYENPVRVLSCAPVSECTVTVLSYEFATQMRAL